MSSLRLLCQHIFMFNIDYSIKYLDLMSLLRLSQEILNLGSSRFLGLRIVLVYNGYPEKGC